MNKFSVLMSLYNGESHIYLDSCFESLLNQTLPANEIILVIDGPISQYLQVVVDKWIVPLNLKVYPLSHNVGLGRALNYGLQLCSHNIVARMDTDDLCEKERFEKQLAMFNANPSLSICGSHILEVDAISLQVISERKVELTNDRIIKKLPYKNPFNHMTVMYNKEDVESVGGYKHLPYMEDWYLWIRMLSAGFLGANIDDYLVRARTGREMIRRRSGFIYVKSEWLITKIKLEYNVSGFFISYLVFIKRTIPRLMPKLLLEKIYLLSRRFG